MTGQDDLMIPGMIWQGDCFAVPGVTKQRNGFGHGFAMPTVTGQGECFR